MSDTIKKNAIQYLHIAIMLILMFGVGFLPPFGQINRNWDESTGLLFRHYLWAGFY